jgi:hypothetical protein
MANSTPSGVAMSMSNPASSRLCARAWVYWGSWKIDWLGSPHHQRVEKPCQTLRDLPALKLNRMAMATGTSAHAM